MASEVLQELHLTQGAFGEDLLAEDICDLLYGNALSRLVVGGRADNTICSLTELFSDSVSLVDDEFLIEDLERLPPVEIAHGDCVVVCGIR